MSTIPVFTAETTGAELHQHVLEEGVQLQTLLAIAQHENAPPETLHELTDYQNKLLKYIGVEDFYWGIHDLLLAVASHRNSSSETIDRLLRANAWFEYEGYPLYEDYFEPAIRENPHTSRETRDWVCAQISIHLVRFPVAHGEQDCRTIDEKPKLASISYQCNKTVREWRETYLPGSQFNYSPSCEGKVHTSHDFGKDLEMWVSVPDGITIEDPEDYIRRNFTWL